MKQLLSNIIKVAIIFLTILGVYLLSNYYGSLMEYQTDYIVAVNVVSSVLVGTLQFLIYLVNSKKHLKLTLKQNSQIPTDEISLRKLAWKRQVNCFSIPILILGFSNLVFFLLFFNLVNNYWIGATSLLMTTPVFGYFESLKELRDIYSGKNASYSVNSSGLEYNIDNEIHSYDLKKLNFLQKLRREVILMDTISKRKIILKLK